MPERPSLRVENISKGFPGVQALDDVTLDLRAGEVHALCGENGAGKSTLMKILGGHFAPDRGTISIGDETLDLGGPLDAKRKGILLIHQEISLVPELSVAENIFLGALPRGRMGGLDRARLNARAREVLAEFGYNLDPARKVAGLSIARQQMIEIARAAAFETSFVIFDEPTASLTDTEAEALFRVIERLKARGVGIVYISHRMKEIFDIADRITVLRDGRLRGTMDTADTDEAEVTRLMIGRSLDAYFDHGTASAPGEEVLRLEGFTSGKAFRDIDLSLRAGEIVGLYGLVGAGRSEIAEAIFGLRKVDRGRLFWRQREVSIRHSDQAIALGIGLVPESRKEQGLVLSMSALQNLSLARLSRIARLGVVSRSQEAGGWQAFKDRLSISAARPQAPVSRLSGGNQQKIVIGKWLGMNPKLLILDEPTRGIDVGSKAEIHRLVADLAAQGMAILVISSEMPEILGLSHRIHTVYEGRITGAFSAEEATEEKLLDHVTARADRAMTGVSQ